MVESEDARVLGASEPTRKRRRSRRGLAEVRLESPKDAVDLLQATLAGVRDRSVSPAAAGAVERLVARFIEVHSQYVRESGLFATVADQRRATAEKLKVYQEARRRLAWAQLDELIPLMRLTDRQAVVIRKWLRGWASCGRPGKTAAEMFAEDPEIDSEVNRRIDKLCSGTGPLMIDGSTKEVQGGNDSECGGTPEPVV